MPKNCKEKAAKAVGVAAMVAGGAGVAVGIVIAAPAAIIIGGVVLVGGAPTFLIANDIEHDKKLRSEDPLLHAIDLAQAHAENPEQEALWRSERSRHRRERARLATRRLATTAQVRVSSLEAKIKEVAQREQAVPKTARPLGWVRKPDSVQALDLTKSGATTWPERGLTSKAMGSRPMRFGASC